jgi:hypothetical protein
VLLLKLYLSTSFALKAKSRSTSILSHRAPKPGIPRTFERILEDNKAGRRSVAAERSKLKAQPEARDFSIDL